MYRIGEFSQIIELPIKTIRYYDEIGILKPNFVDPFTKYRMYDLENLEDCKKIILLKRFGFTLEEIKTMLKGSISEQILEDKQLELQEEIREKQQIVYEIEIMKDELTKPKEKEPQKVYRMERKVV